MKKDDPFNYLPISFHIKNGKIDPEYKKFLQFFNERK